MNITYFPKMVADISSSMINDEKNDLGNLLSLAVNCNHIINSVIIDLDNYGKEELESLREQYKARVKEIAQNYKPKKEEIDDKEKEIQKLWSEYLKVGKEEDSDKLYDLIIAPVERSRERILKKRKKEAAEQRKAETAARREAKKAEEAAAKEAAKKEKEVSKGSTSKTKRD